MLGITLAPDLMGRYCDVRTRAGWDWLVTRPTTAAAGAALGFSSKTPGEQFLVARGLGELSRFDADMSRKSHFEVITRRKGQAWPPFQVYCGRLQVASNGDQFVLGR